MYGVFVEAVIPKLDDVMLNLFQHLKKQNLPEGKDIDKAPKVKQLPKPFNTETNTYDNK